MLMREKCRIFKLFFVNIFANSQFLGERDSSKCRKCLVLAIDPACAMQLYLRSGEKRVRARKRPEYYNTWNHH